MKILLATLCSYLLMAGASHAADPPETKNLNNGCSRVTICDASTDTTANCDDVVAPVEARYTLTFYATQSTATALSCTVYSSDNGYHATRKSEVVGPLSASSSGYAASVSGLFKDIWVECPTITGGNVTITMLACPIAR